MTRAGSTTSETPRSATGAEAGDVERELDRLSLEEALRDFEIANARVIDLTQRLVDLGLEVTALREQLVGTQEALVHARRENEAIRATMTFKLADLVRKVRARVRR